MTKTQHKRTAVVSMFQNGISRSTKCAERDGFRREGHNYYQLFIASSTSIMLQENSVYCCSLQVYVYVIVLYLFYIKRLFTILFSFHLQTKDSDTNPLMVTNWWWQKSTKQPTFKSISFIVHYKLVNNPIHGYKLLLFASFSDKWEKPMKQPTLKLSFITH